MIQLNPPNKFFKSRSVFPIHFPHRIFPWDFGLLHFLAILVLGRRLTLSPLASADLRLGAGVRSPGAGLKRIHQDQWKIS